MKKNSKEFKSQVDIINKIEDKDIDLSDIPELTKKDLINSERGKFYKPIKRSTTIRLDADVIEWFKYQSESKGYQTKINEVLRKFMLTEIHNKRSHN